MPTDSDAPIQHKKRPNGEGSVSFYNNRWVARYSFRDGDKLRRRQFSAVSRDAAEEWLRQKSPTRTEWKPTLIKPAKPRFGEVYFVQGVGGGPIKIGWTTSIDARFSALQVGSPVKLRVVGLISGVDREAEAELHGVFEGLRLHGEWFEDAKELVAFIQRLPRVEDWFDALADPIEEVTNEPPAHESRVVRPSRYSA